MEDEVTLTVVIPAHNEEQEIQEAIARLRFVMSEIRMTIIVVNDGSTDNTLQKLTSIADKDMKIISHFPNRGKGYALRVGLRLCDTPFVAYLDGDLDLDPSALVAGLRVLQGNPNVNGAIGSKLHPDSVIVYSPIRRFISQGYRLFVKILFRVGVSDTQTGLKIFRSESLSQVLEDTHADGWAFDLELLALMSRKNFSITEIPVRLDHKFDTNLNLRGSIKAIKETLNAFYEIKMRRK